MTRTASEVEQSKLRRAERAITIGDTLMGGHLLDGWSPAAVGLPAGFDGRVEDARRRLAELRAEETAHGRFCRLDRSAPEIVLHEREVLRRGWRSICGPGGGPPASAINSATRFVSTASIVS